MNRVRVLWEVLQIGNLIAAPKSTVDLCGDGDARVTTTYAWWYRPLIAVTFWICGTSDTPKEHP